MISKKKNRLWRLYMIGAILPLLALACGMFSANTSPINAPGPQIATLIVPTPQPIVLPQAVVDEQSALEALYQRVNPAVVNITTYAKQSGDMTALGQGSGFVIDNEGHIVTNSHVVQDAEQLDVIFSDGSTRTGKVVGKDLNSDLAVVKVDNLPGGVNFLKLGNMASVIVGETVVAIGNPFGLDGTLTKGIVSAVGRTIPSLTAFSIPMAIQTDAAINPGNSGGPLLNLQGEVVGVNAQIETGGTSRSNSGVGFSIPVSLVQKVVPELIKSGSYTWPWLGVKGGNLQPEQISAMKLSIDKGAYLSSIVQGGPAEKAGLKGSTDTGTVNGRKVETGGDVVTAINGQAVTRFDDLLIYVAFQTTPGEEVTLSVLRDGKQQDIKLKLEPRPDNVQ
jgi:S1-C subfamily serine protease